MGHSHFVRRRPEKAIPKAFYPITSGEMSNITKVTAAKEANTYSVSIISIITVSPVVD